MCCLVLPGVASSSHVSCNTWGHVYYCLCTFKEWQLIEISKIFSHIVVKGLWGRHFNSCIFVLCQLWGQQLVSSQSDHYRRLFSGTLGWLPVVFPNRAGEGDACTFFARFALHSRIKCRSKTHFCCCFWLLTPVIIVQILKSLNTSWCRRPLVQLIILIIRVEFNLNLTPILDNYIAIQPNMKTITAIVMLISLEIIKY